MGDYHFDDECDRQDAEALEAAEQLILEVANRDHPESLSALRESIERDAPEHIDRAVLRLALWSLLNEDRLELTPDRALRVAG